jgi:hypothetical protein
VRTLDNEEVVRLRGLAHKCRVLAGECRTQRSLPPPEK